MTYSEGYNNDTTDTTSESNQTQTENSTQYTTSDVESVDSSNDVVVSASGISAQYMDTRMGEIESGVNGFNLTSSSRSVGVASNEGLNSDLNLSGREETLHTGAIDHYECELEYGRVDKEAIAQQIMDAGRLGVSEYKEKNVNRDRDTGEKLTQFNIEGEPVECVNILTPGGWNYIDYTIFSDFSGDLGGNVVPLRTTPFGPPTRRANYSYSNARSFKGKLEVGVILGNKAVDFNLILDESHWTSIDNLENMTVLDIDKDTEWQSGPRIDMNSKGCDRNVVTTPSFTCAGGEMTSGVAINKIGMAEVGYDYEDYKNEHFEFYSNRNCEQTWKCTSPKDKRIDYSARQLIYVAHEREDDSDTSADFGVMGVSGWLYGLNTLASQKMQQEYAGYTPEYPHGGAAIHYVYGVYKKDKSDEELEQLELDLQAYIKYVQDLLETIQQEEDDTAQANAAYAFEPNSEYRIQPQLLFSMVESGLLDRMAAAVLPSNDNNHFLLQLTCEFLCARLPCNEGKLPHEYEFPFTHDRLCEQLAADGTITMEVVLDYLYAVYNNVPDSIMESIGYIPRIRDIANFTHHEIFPEDPEYFRHFLYTFVLWACRPSAPKKIQRLTFDVLPATGLFVEVPMPVIWWEDGTYLTYSEWLNYETGGWESECFRNDGKPIVSPKVITLQDGSEAYNELICWDDETEEVYSTRSEHCLMALSGALESQSQNDEDTYDDLEDVPNRFYDMMKYRKKMLRGFLKSWSNVTEYSMNYEIPDEFADLTNPARELYKGRKIENRKVLQQYVNPNLRFGPSDGEEVYNWNMVIAREEDWKYYTRWIPPSPPQPANGANNGLLCWYQKSLGFEPSWSDFNKEALNAGTYEFSEYVHKSRIPPEGNAPHGDKEMITNYVWVSHNDLYDEFNSDPDYRLQKPNFTFWWGLSRQGQQGKNWATGGAYIKIESPKIINGELDKTQNKTKTYKFSVPSGPKDNTRKNRYFRIGAYYFKGTSMVNDKTVMGDYEDWYTGKYFHLEIRPARKNEKDPTKNTNKGPVYHANSDGMSGAGVAELYQPLWYDTYWKNPRNFVKDGARALDMNQWYKVRWNTSYSDGKAVIPNLRFWWGRDDETQNPIDIPADQREGAFQGTAQFLFNDDEESYYFKPKTKYLYFGGFDSGRNMDQWSKDGEPWVTVSRHTDPVRVGPSYFASATEAFGNGDFDISNVHWEQEFTYLSREKLPYELTIPLYIKRNNINVVPNETNYALIVNAPQRVAGASSDGMKATRIWRFIKSSTSSSRSSHMFQFGYNAFSGYAYLLLKDMSNKYSTDGTIGNVATGESRYTGFHTATPIIPHDLPENRAYRIHDSNSTINWGVFDVKDSTTPESGNVKKKRTLKNWSRLGEEEQLTCLPAMEECGPFYWALHSHNQPYMSESGSANTGKYREPGHRAEGENYLNFLLSMGTKKGAVNIYHAHWPGYESQRFMAGGDRFNEITQALNSRFDPDKPEGPNNKRVVDIRRGKKYKITFPTQEKGLEIADACWTFQHKMPGSEGVANHNANNLKYNMPMDMKWKVNWNISPSGSGWNMDKNSHLSTKYHNLMGQGHLNIDVDPIEMTYGETYKLTAKGSSFVFGVYEFSGWRVKDLISIGKKTFQNGDIFNETNVAMNGFTNDYRSMFNWSPYGIDFPFEIKTAEFDQGPEIYANGNSVVNESISAYDKTDMGEINFAFKTKPSTPIEKGDYWETPFNVWTPGKNDHDFWDDLYGTGDVQATKIKKGYMYKVEFVKSDSKEQPWSSTFCFLTDDLVKNKDKTIQRFHYPTSKDGFDPDTKLVKRAFKGEESRYFPDKGGYAKTSDGKVIRMEHSSPANNHVLILATTNNLLMGAHNPNQLVDMESQVEGIPMGFKDENQWNKKGDQTHFKITETKLDYWKDGYAYWAAKDHDDNGRANFFSNHWNLPLKHVAPGFIVEGDEYEITADTNMSSSEVYHLWWAPEGVENHFAASDEITQNLLRNALTKDAQTIVKGTTVRVKAKGNRLLLAATNTGVLKEEYWPKDAKGAPIKIRRMPGEKDPFGPGYYGTKKDTNDNRYGLDNVYWKDIWDWNSWLSYQDANVARSLDRFKRGRTYRIKRRDTDFSNLPSPGKPLTVKYDYEVIAARDPEALVPGLYNSMNFELLGELTPKNTYIDVKSVVNAEILFSTINTPNNRDITNWDREGEVVHVDVIDKGENYESGPGYWGKKNGAQFLKPDFCNEHYLSPLNSDKVDKGVAYQIRRSKVDAPGMTCTYKLYNCKESDLVKQHEQNAKFTDIDITLPPKRNSTPVPWQYFIPDEGNSILYGVYDKQYKLKITDWSIDGEEVDVELKKLDVDTEKGPLYWANHRLGEPLYQEVDWESDHWVTPVNSLTKVSIKQLNGVTVIKQYKAFQTYSVKPKAPLPYDVSLYECNSLYPTYPTNNNDYKKLGTLKKGAPNEIRITPTRQNIFLGASNINESDFRHADHRYWPRRGVECELLFEEINYPNGPGYWADHSSAEAASGADGPWFSKTNQPGNIQSTFSVKQPILSKSYWMEINTLDGVSVGPKFEIKPMPGKTYPYTITLWQAPNKSDTDPSKAKARNWTKASETRKKGSNEPMVCTFTGKYVIVGCQSTGAALVDTQWSPRGEDIELMITKIVDTEGSSYYGTYHSASRRGSTAWNNKHWEKYNWLVSASGVPLIPTMEYKASVSKNTRNKKYRHSIWQSYTKPNDYPMTTAQESAILYGADVAKGSGYGSTFKMNNIKGTQGIYLICSTHKFTYATSAKDKNRSLTNWSPKGEYVQLNTVALGADWVPSHGMIGKILAALSALATALALLIMLLKYVPPTDWLMQYNKNGPRNEVFPAQIPCDGRGNGRDSTYAHGFNWDNHYHISTKWSSMLTPHCFFWSAEPKFMNLYADEYASIIARMYGLRHHGYFFDVTNVKANTQYDTAGLGFTNLTQTFSAGIIRNTNPGMMRISLCDNKGGWTRTKQWGKRLIINGKRWKYTDRDNAPNQQIKDAIDEHFAGTAGGTLMQDGTLLDASYATAIWKRNSRRRWFTASDVDSSYAYPGDIIGKSSSEFTYAWPRVINTSQSSIYKRSIIRPQQKWFTPAMVRAVDSMVDDTFAIATMNGWRPTTKKAGSDRMYDDGPPRQLKTMRLASNRGRVYSSKVNDDYSSMVASTRSDKMHWNVLDFPWTTDYGSGEEYFMDNIFTDTGFTCHIQDYWKSEGNSHQHAWIMAMEEENSFPTNSDSGGNDEFYFGLEFTLDALRNASGEQDDYLHMTFMGMNFDTEDGEYDYHDLYPTKETDYLLRFNGVPGTSTQLKRQHTGRGGPIKFQMWSTRKIKFNSIMTKLYWGFYCYETGSSKKRAYWGHNISNLRPLSSSSNPRGNLITNKKDWDAWKIEQEAENSG